MPEPNIGDRNSHGSRVHEFRTAKLRRGSPARPGAARMIEDYYDFQWVLIFERSVNYRR
jgi:hypothetical protein